MNNYPSLFPALKLCSILPFPGFRSKNFSSSDMAESMWDYWHAHRAKSHSIYPMLASKETLAPSTLIEFHSFFEWAHSSACKFVFLGHWILFWLVSLIWHWITFFITEGHISKVRLFLEANSGWSCELINHHWKKNLNRSWNKIYKFSSLSVWIYKCI